MSNRYILISLLILGLSGCVERRTITINTYDMARSSNTRHSRTRVIRREPIREEILIGRGGATMPNRNVVTRVDEVVPVPPNRPTLDIKQSTSSRVTPEPSRNFGVVTTGLNGRIMQRMPFPIDEYNSLPKNGSSTISGRVYLINSIDDEQIIKRNLKLYLNPVTSYSRQWYEHSYLEGYKMTPPDKRLYNYLKFTTTDSNGEFSFFGVPAGEYYLGVKLRCGGECGYDGEKIIRVVKEVYVGDGGTTSVDLTKVVP